VDSEGYRPVKLDSVIPTAMIYTMNASEPFNAAFREPAARKKALHGRKFQSDLRNAHDVGMRLVQKIKEVRK
jgi:hypothetical protein